jgi:hypothetical protein
MYVRSIPVLIHETGIYRWMPIIYGDLCPATNYLDLPVRCRCGWQYLQKGRAFVNGGILCPVGFEMGSIFFWSEGGCVVYTFNKKK